MRAELNAGESTFLTWSLREEITSSAYSPDIASKTAVSPK
jgi:hypothetical protein